MSKYTLFLCLFTYFCVSCNTGISCSTDTSPNHIEINLDERLSLRSLNNYLQIDSLIPISSDEYSIFHFDKIVHCNSDIYVLDKTQQAVFGINTSSKVLKRIINFRGAAKNEYIAITDIAVDEHNNIYVFDSDSKKINQYDKEGKFLRSIKVSYGTSIALSKENEIAINSNQLENDQITVYTLTGELKYNIPTQPQLPRYTLDDIGSITSQEDKIIYTTPFDFNIYQADKNSNASLALLNFGSYQFNVKDLEKLDYKEYQKLLLAENDKVMLLDHIGAYQNLVFLSTDRNDQLVYDIENNIVIVLSNVETPYNILFSTPLSVNADGQFCTVISNSNICNGYNPWVETNGTKLPQLSYTKNHNINNNTFWLLMGCIK